MSEVGRRTTGRRAVAAALFAAAVLAGLVGGWAVGSGVAAHPHTSGGHVLATDGAIIVEN